MMGYFLMRPAVELHHLLGVLLRLFLGRQDVLALLVEGAGCRIQGDADVAAGLISGLFNRLDDEDQGLLVGLQVGRKTALVAHGGVVALRLEDRAQVVEDLGTHADPLAEAPGADGHDHEFLDVHVVVGVHPAIDDIHMRDGDVLGRDPADVTVQGHPEPLRGGPGTGERDGEDGVCPEGALGFRPVELDHRVVEPALFEDIHPDDLGADLQDDILDRLLDALAEIALLVAVSKLQGLALARGGPGGHRRPADGSRHQHHLRLDGGVAP